MLLNYSRKSSIKMSNINKTKKSDYCNGQRAGKRRD